MNSGEKLTLPLCYSYIDETLFKLSPPQLQEKHPTWPGYVGVEIEMLPVNSKGNAESIPSPYARKESPVIPTLSKLAQEKGWELVYEKHEDETLVLVLKISSGETITFEPGGQVEYSSQPFRCLEDAEERLSEIQTLIDSVLKDKGVTLLQTGVNPWHGVEEVGIQNPKHRYIAMNQYFKNIASPTAVWMMRQTCSIQVCLDFGQEDSLMLKRYLAAQLIAPTAAAIFANSPYREKKFTDSLLSHRTSIWRSLDSKRTGFVGLKELAKNLTREVCVQTYLDFALSSPVVFVEHMGYFVPTNALSMKEWMMNGIQGVFPTLDDFITHVSLLFPEVRPRGYMELRSVDCLPRVWQIAPAAFYVGLLYDRKNLDTILERMLPKANEIEDQMLLACKGLHTEVLSTQAQWLMKSAIQGLGRISKLFCGDHNAKTLKAFFHHFTERGRTPADDIVDFVKREGRSCPTLSDFALLENDWVRLLT